MNEQTRTRRRRYWVMLVVLIGSAYVARTSPGAAERNGRPPMLERVLAALAGPLERPAYRLADGLRAVAVSALWPRALESEAAVLQQQTEEDTRLSAALAAAVDPFKAPAGLETDAALLGWLQAASTPAVVLGRDPTGRRDLLLLGTGATAGARRGMSVISGADLVGGVDRVNRSTCVAYVVVDREFRAAARCVRSQDFLGTARGDGRGRLTLAEIPLGADLREGDVVVTGPDPHGPAPGLRIGTVEQVGLGQPAEEAVVGPAARAAVKLVATVRPMADLRKLREVAIAPGPDGVPAMPTP